MKNPKWNRKLIKNLTWKDYRNLKRFYKIFMIKMDPTCKAMIASIEAGKQITLEDQRLLSRTLLGDLAKRTHVAFIGVDKICKGLSKECAEHLAAANKEAA